MDHNGEKPVGAETTSDQPQTGKRPVRRRRRYSSRRQSKPPAAVEVKPPSEALAANTETAAADLQEPAERQIQAGAGEPAERQIQAEAGEPAERQIQAGAGEPAERQIQAGAGEPAESAVRVEDASPVAKKRRHRGGRRRRRRPSGSLTPSAGLSAGNAPAVAGLEPDRPPAAKPEAETPAVFSRNRPAIQSQPQPGQAQRMPATPLEEAKPRTVWLPESEAKSAYDAQRALKYPGLEMAKAKKRLLDFIWEQKEVLGSGKAVIGLSGGLDSLIAAALTVEALGRDNVRLYFFLDGDKYNAAERERARLVASRLGCTLEVRDLRAHLNLYFEQDKQVSADRRLRRLAWEIMSWLSDIAQQQSAMLAGNYNKTKRLLGLWPFYPLAASWNLLGDVYHSQMRDLARHLNIPPLILDQSQERHDLPVPGLSLNLADGLLYQMVDQKISLARLMDLGIAEDKIGWLYRRLKATAWQQKYPPQPDMTSAYVPKAWNVTAET